MKKADENLRLKGPIYIDRAATCQFFSKGFKDNSIYEFPVINSSHALLEDSRV